VESRRCKHCGREFTPVDAKGVGSSRLYCYHPECEKDRDRIKREYTKERRKKKRSMVKE
jgi:hypothetical protein